MLKITRLLALVPLLSLCLLASGCFLFGTTETRTGDISIDIKSEDPHFFMPCFDQIRTNRDLTAVPIVIQALRSNVLTKRLMALDTLIHILEITERSPWGYSYDMDEAARSKAVAVIENWYSKEGKAIIDARIEKKKGNYPGKVKVDPK